jgi:anti-sigma factor RsiW
MPWSCEQTEARLSELLEGGLGLSELRAWEAHRDACTQCRQLVAATTYAMAALRELPPAPVPADLIPRILQQTGRRRLVGRRWWPALSPRMALAAASVALFVFFLLQTLPSPAHSILAELDPARLYWAVNRRVHLVYARSVKVLSDLRVVYELQTRIGTLTQPAPESPSRQRSGDDPGTSQMRWIRLEVRAADSHGRQT